MSLTPLCPHGPIFRLKAVVGNRQEDVTELEELENQRLLAALVASLDMKLNYKKIAYYHGTVFSTTVRLLHPALLDASSQRRTGSIIFSWTDSKSKVRFSSRPTHSRHDMSVKRARMHIAQLHNARQSKEKTKEEGGFSKGVVMMSKRLEGFEIGRDVADKMQSMLGKRRREKDESEEDSA